MIAMLSPTPSRPARGPRRERLRLSKRPRVHRRVDLILLGLVTFAFGLLASGLGHAQTCGLTGRVLFAGHAFPLDGTLVEETLAFDDPFPQWSGAGLARPTFVTFPPDGTNRIAIAERDGRVLTIPNRPDVQGAEMRTLLDIQNDVDSSFTEEGLLGLAFHPDFASNGFFYLHYTANPAACVGGGRCALIVRYQVDPLDPDRSLPGSRYVVLEIDRPGTAEHHNGGMISFGKDGYLYASIGDQDVLSLPQDTNSLRGKILRIDVDSGSERSPGIPAGNPFASPVYHYGLRNPWRFSFDRESPGDLWVTDVGLGDREEVNWLPEGTPAGRNFGWPDCEGTLSRTPTGCQPSQQIPDLEYSNAADRLAVIGGYVYRGPLASLNGHYIFADFSGAVFSWDRTTRNPGTGQGVIELRLTLGSFIGSFGEDEAGELYTWDYFGSPQLGRFVGSSASPGDPFPPTLSATGLFSNVATLTPAPGLIEYDVETELWSDGAAKKRWIALPGSEKIGFRSAEPWQFPVGTAIVKHFELEQSGAAPRRLETRVMLRQPGKWIGFTYRWNAQGTDASLLLDSFREDVPLAGGGTQAWHYPSPAECLGCHAAAPGRVLGVRTEQLNSDFDYGAVTDNQLHAWNCIGLFDTDIGAPSGFDRYVSLDDTTASLNARVRSYLQVNCATCHQPGTGLTTLDLRRSVLLGDMGAIDHPPIRGDLGLSDPRLIDPGDYTNSIVSVRAESALENIRMARGTLLEDTLATSVLASWIDDVLFDVGSGTAWLDSDEDGVADASDNCPAVPNPGQENLDSDDLGDPCDPDHMPELRPLTSLPNQADPGETLSLTGWVMNDGVLSAAANQVRFRLSVDTQLDELDQSVGDCFVQPIAGSGFRTCTDVEAIVPLEPANGDGLYYWIACVDALDQVAEGDESNNCAVEAVAIPEPSQEAMQMTALLAVALAAFLRSRRREV